MRSRSSFMVETIETTTSLNELFKRAHVILDKLEEEPKEQMMLDLTLLQKELRALEPNKPSLAIKALKEANPDFMTPKEALDFIYELKMKLGG